MMICDFSKDEGNTWIRFQGGDKAAYAYIYNTYYKKLCNYGLRIVADKTLVEDGIQDLFIRLWKQKGGLAVPRSIQAYLFQSLRRDIYRSIEKRKRDGHFTLDETYNYRSYSSHEMELITRERRAEQQSNLETAIASLTNRQREVIFLKFYLKMSYQEIAGIMELNVDSVYNLISKALNALQERFSSPLHFIASSDYH
jgi:RNA polymerase sigma factor (sigma-70 family)